MIAALRADYRQGDLLWVDLGSTVGHEQGGDRPALVVSGNAALSRPHGTFLIAPLTRRDRGWAEHVPVEGRGGRAFVQCDQVRAVSPERVRRRAGRLDAETVTVVLDAIVALLGRR